MESFAISSPQIVRVLGSLFADELARNFNRHIDFLTIASWSGETEFGNEGLKLSAAEVDACMSRSAVFFGLPQRFFADKTVSDFSAAAHEISTAINLSLRQFAFSAAARDMDNGHIQHPADQIFQDAAAAANVLYGRRRMLSFVAPHSLLGFILTIITPNLQRIESIDARGMTPEALAGKLTYGDVLVATPTLWRYMMRENLKAPDNAMAVSFGEAMASDLAADMRKAGFGVMREIYGSTESGLIGWRDAPTESFVLFDHWRQDGDDPVRITPDGETAPAAAMDYLEWTGERSFRLSGRRDGAVQVGAVNVHPDAVARQLRQHPAVDDCVVRVSRRDDGVTRLVAHITLMKGRSPDERIVRDIDAWSRTSLRQQERPRIYHFHESLREQGQAASTPDEPSAD